MQDVIDAGACSGEVTHVDSTDGAYIMEVRYRFASRRAFTDYERDHARRLRQDGLDRFGPQRGIRFERTTSVLVTSIGL